MADLAIVHPVAGFALGLLAGLIVWRITAELARARDLSPLGGGLFWIVLAAAYGAVALWRHGMLPLGAGMVVLGAIAVAIIAFDFAHRRIPDELSLAVAVLGLLVAWDGGRLVSGLVAGLGGAALLWGASALYGRLRGREGVGFGDVKLTVGLGLWLGPVGLLWGYLGASLVLVVLGLSMRLRGPLADDPPFGPGYLAVALVLLVTGVPSP